VIFVFRYAFREQRTVPSGIANLLEAIISFFARRSGFAQYG